MIHALGHDRPKLNGRHHFIAPNATVIGSVVLGDRVSIWFNAVVRGDLEHIAIGSETNVQDGAVLHTDHGAPLVVGRRVTVGHMAILHGCTVGDFSLIGMHAVVLNGATVGRHSIVGSNALVPEAKTIPDRSLVVGTPARIKRQVTDEEVARMDANVAWYLRAAERYRAELTAETP